MRRSWNLLACDCGNSSIRVVLCRYDGKRLTAETVLQEPNTMIRIGEYAYWDMLRIFQIIKEGIRQAAGQVESIDSMGICTWGVDFALFEENGIMLTQPLSYRNSIGAQAMEEFDADTLRQMFFDTGILSDKINSAFMLRGMGKQMPSLLQAADKLLLIPDILNYFFTGRMLNEPSELSTTQLYDVATNTISEKQCSRMGVDATLFSTVGQHGRVIGNLLPEIREELRLDYDIPVVCVPSHDTASAVMGVPATEQEFAFISAGTWALIGMHLDRPVITQAVLDAGLTNEVGAFGHITLLKNSVGLFIMQCLRREYAAAAGHKVSWKQLDERSRQFQGAPLLFDVNHPDFFHPASMAEAIWNRLQRTGQIAGGQNWSAILAAAQASLATSYADGIDRVFRATGKRFDTVYVVGGGAKDQIINQRFVDITGLEVAACEMECASVGAAVSQVAALEPDLDYGALKKIVADSLGVARYSRKTDQSDLLSRYREGLR